MVSNNNEECIFKAFDNLSIVLKSGLAVAFSILYNVFELTFDNFESIVIDIPFSDLILFILLPRIN